MVTIFILITRLVKTENRMEIRHRFGDLPNLAKILRDMSRGLILYAKGRQDVEFYSQGKVQLGKTSIAIDIVVCLHPVFL